jgi:hypothetical protein
MPAPVAAPLAAPIAGAAVKGAAQGIGAALRYGPGLLQLADAFRRPGGLGGTVADVPRRQKLAELMRDALRGAQLPVAVPPSPGFPGGSPIGPFGPLLPWDAAARALVAALGQVFRWGDETRVDVGVEDGIRPDVREILWSFLRTGGSRAFVTNITVEPFRPEGGPTEAKTFPDPPSGYDPQYWPTGSWFKQGRNIFRFSLSSKTAHGYPEACESGFPMNPVEGASEAISMPGELYLTEPPTFVVGPCEGVRQYNDGFIYRWTFVDDSEGVVAGVDFEALTSDLLRELEPAPMPGPPVPLAPSIPPLADPLPADPTTSDNPEALTAPAPVVPPLPAYVPRPLPGPVLPEFEPEPEADPSRGPGTDRPARPVIPGDRPGPTVPAPVRPFPDVPAEPGVFPDNPPGPGETPNTPPAPGVTPNTPPGPVIDPGVFPQPGPPATPTGPDGNPAVPDTDTTTDTPTDQHTPVAGDDPVTGNGPAPTLQAMAREMGRQEQKLGRLLERVGNPSRPPDEDRPNLMDNIKEALLDFLKEALLTSDGPGSYDIASPCNIDPATGEPAPPLSAEWGLSIGLERNILKRLDALAELVQHHKDLPQPICRGPRPTGEHVTVNFEQVPDDLEAPP